MCPPLALFSEYGYRTYGIEISDSQREKALNFSQEYAFELNISAGDMRVLPFEDESISFIYSYNSIFHMKKKDIEKAIGEIKRVLKPQGILCVNFLSIDDEGYGMGKQLEKNEFLQLERGEQVIHSYYAVNEAERYFKDMEILFKETRLLSTMQNEKIIKQGISII